MKLECFILVFSWLLWGTQEVAERVAFFVLLERHTWLFHPFTSAASVAEIRSPEV